MARDIIRQQKAAPARSLLAIALGAAAVGAVAIGALAIGRRRPPGDWEGTF